MVQVMDLKMPVASLQSLVVRLLSEILVEHYLPAMRGSALGDGQIESDADSQIIPTSSTLVHSHPVMKAALKIVGLVTDLHIGEGKAIKTLTAGVLSLVIKAHPPPPRGTLHVQLPLNQILSNVGIHRDMVRLLGAASTLILSCLTCGCVDAKCR